jgi:hypothetical protein
MVGLRYAFVVILAGGCGSKTFPSLCDQNPPPPACGQTCDPSMASTCPVGFFCDPGSKHCNQECTAGGTQCGGGYMCTSDGQCVPTGSCSGLQCQQVNCSSMGMAADATTITGKVFAPNGTHCPSEVHI